MNADNGQGIRSIGSDLENKSIVLMSNEKLMSHWSFVDLMYEHIGVVR
jgi:hypothetical protein